VSLHLKGARSNAVSQFSPIQVHQGGWHARMHGTGRSRFFRSTFKMPRFVGGAGWPLLPSRGVPTSVANTALRRNLAPDVFGRLRGRVVPHVGTPIATVLAAWGGESGGTSAPDPQASKLSPVAWPSNILCKCSSPPFAHTLDRTGARCSPRNGAKMPGPCRNSNASILFVRRPGEPACAVTSLILGEFTRVRRLPNSPPPPPPPPPPP
jgi:hypothetical protein